MKNRFVYFALFALRRYVWPTSSQRSTLLFWLFGVIVLLTACSAAVAQTLPTVTPDAVSVPTYTPTPAVAAAGAANTNIAEIDAHGLDIAERRVIDVYARVAPAVVNITTKTLRRSFFFDVVPEVGAGSGFVL